MPNHDTTSPRSDSREMRGRAWTRAAVYLGCGLLLSSLPKVAMADGPPRTDTRDHEAAAAAFEQARRSIEAGDCAAAVPKLEESLRNEPSIGAHLSYADCFEATDPYLTYVHLRDATLLAFVRNDERYFLSEKRASALLPKVAAVHVATSIADLDDVGFVLRVDNKPVDRFHLSSPIGLRPGEHVLSATTADGRSWTQRVVAETGRVINADVVLQAPAPSPRARSSSTSVGPTAPSSHRGSTQRTLGVIASAIGASGIAAGAAFGVVTLARRNDLDRACNGDIDACTGNPRSVNPIMVSAENSATASTILFTAGAAALAAGIALYITAPRGSATGSVARAPERGMGSVGLGNAVVRW